MPFNDLTPAKRYLRAANKAGWLRDYRNPRALECGWCISLETKPSSAGEPRRYRYSLHGLKHSIGNDGRMPFRPDQLQELPLEGDEHCFQETENYSRPF